MAHWDAPFPARGPPYNARIDYLWKADASRLTPTNAEVGYTLEASDHYPVLSQFVFDQFTNHAAGFYFPCDEGAGTRTRDVISGLIAKFGTDAPAWSANSPSGQPGDGSLYFNGAQKLVATDTNQIIGTNGVNDSYTLQAWVKLAANYMPPQRAILFQYDRKPGFSFSINTNRTLHTTTFKIRDISSPAMLPNDGQWHHVAVVHTDGESMRFYIDAVLAATVAYTNGAGYRTSSDIVIGAADDGANPFTGWLDRVRFDDRALAPMDFDFPAAPSLGIRRNGNSLTLFWPAAMTNYTLQSNEALQTTGWTNLPFERQATGNQAIITPASSAQFFRLRR